MNTTLTLMDLAGAIALLTRGVPVAAIVLINLPLAWRLGPHLRPTAAA